jgi:hypothetical protein
LIKPTWLELRIDIGRDFVFRIPFPYFAREPLDPSRINSHYLLLWTAILLARTEEESISLEGTGFGVVPNSVPSINESTRRLTKPLQNLGFVCLLER